MKEIKIDEGNEYTGFQDALALVLANTFPSGIEERSLFDCAGFVSAEDVAARVDSPSKNASLKDGFAVRSDDTLQACFETPCELHCIGSVFAGGKFIDKLLSGQTVKVSSGAPVPDGADAVVPAEVCEECSDCVRVHAGVKPGQNIHPAGYDVTAGKKVVEEGQVLSPPVMAYAAAAGIGRLRAYRKPRFALMAIGDELAESGTVLKEGQIYASNLVYNRAWLTQLGIPYQALLVKDDAEDIKKQVLALLPEVDGIITSGGVMHSERDLILGVLNSLGWDMKFRHVRLRPGKATSFGLLQGKPVFCFSGGPNSNSLAFLEFALPGIFRMLGLSGEPLQTIKAVLTEDLKSRNRHWFEFREGRLEKTDTGEYQVTPVKEKSRLKSMAVAECLIIKPEGLELLKSGQPVTVQLLPGCFHWQG